MLIKPTTVNQPYIYDPYELWDGIHLPINLVDELLNCSGDSNTLELATLIEQTNRPCWTRRRRPAYLVELALADFGFK